MDAVKVVVVKEPSHVVQRLQELGLDVDTLHAAVKAGLAEGNLCTPNDPPGFRGLIVWGKTLRRLREILILRKWRRTNRRRLAAIASPDGTFAVAVSTGDERTGLDGADPQTSRGKGPAWVAALEENQEQLELIPRDDVSEDEADQDDEQPNRLTRVLLFYIDRNETRCELSTPKDMGPDAKLDAWVERILLPAIPHEPEPALEEPVPSAPIDVPVKRRVD